MGAGWLGRLAGIVVAPLVIVACSGTSAVSTSGAASVTGDGAGTGANVGTVRSAVFYTGVETTNAGSDPIMIIDFFDITPGVSCKDIPSEARGTVGNLVVKGEPSSLPGRAFGLSTTAASLVLYGLSVTSSDGSIDNGPGQFLVSANGTVTFASATSPSGALSGTFEATMEISGANGMSADVTGTFTAPSCGSS